MTRGYTLPGLVSAVVFFALAAFAVVTAEDAAPSSAGASVPLTITGGWGHWECRP